MVSRCEQVYFAMLAEQAERYDEMASHMETVAKLKGELSMDERNLLSIGYKNAVGSRRAAWRIITRLEHKEAMQGNEDNSRLAREYCTKIESELQNICDSIISLLDGNLIRNATVESKVFYQKMKGDYCRYISEFSVDDARLTAVDNARLAYEEGTKVAKKGLVVTHPVRLGLALNYSVFLSETLCDTDEACKMARTAFEDAIAGFVNVADDSYKEAALIMQLLWDNFMLWTSEQ